VSGPAGAPRRPKRRRRLPRALRIVLLIAVALIVLAIGGTVATSSYEQRPLGYIGSGGDPSPPAWTKSCQRRDGKSGRRYMLACGHVRGRAVYVQPEDPDEDGDAHAVVIAGPRLVIVKYPVVDGRRPGHLPGLGGRVDAAGTTSPGRDGLTSIDTQSSRPRR